MIDFLLFLFSMLQFAFIYGFYRMYMAHWEHAARIARLEQSKPKPEPKAPEKPQPKQIFEKLVVPGAKEVKPLPIGGGRLQFDSENQVAEWA